MARTTAGASWKATTATTRRPACDPGGLTAPILEYDHSAGDCAIIGGMRYRGSAPSLAGIYFYSDYCSGRIWGATKNGAVWSSSLLLDTPYFVSAFGEDTAGSLYLADYGDGIVYAILASPPPAVGGIRRTPVTAARGNDRHPSAGARHRGRRVRGARYAGLRPRARAPPKAAGNAFTKWKTVTGFQPGAARGHPL